MVRFKKAFTQITKVLDKLNKEIENEEHDLEQFQANIVSRTIEAVDREAELENAKTIKKNFEQLLNVDSK